MSKTALLNLAGAEQAQPGKANGSPERGVRGLGLAGVAEPFRHLSREKAGEGRPWLPTEYSSLWLYRCTSLHRLIIMVHAVNNSVISKFSWLGEGLAVAGVFHDSLPFLPDRTTDLEFPCREVPVDQQSLLTLPACRPWFPCHSCTETRGLTPSLSWRVTRWGGCG